MKMLRIKLVVLVLAAATLMAIVQMACKEKNVPYVVDKDEIVRYLKETTEGKQLFGVDSLILPTPYRMPFDSAIFIDSVKGVTRSFSPVVSEIAADYGHLGMLREALVAVVDEFTVDRHRIVGGVDSVVTQDRTVERWAFFLKLGNDAEDYLGWILWGYNGIGIYYPSSQMAIKTLAGKTMSYDQSFYTVEPESLKLGQDQRPTFIRLDGVDTIPLGAKLAFEATQRGTNNVLYYHLITLASDSGLKTFDMTRLGPNHFVDTLKTAASNPRTYSVIYLQSFIETQDRKFAKSWCVPYRVR
jgi:hypothetical protein